MPDCIQFVPGSNRHPVPKWFIGLDLGQRRDHSALAVVELTWLPRGRCAATFACLYEPALVIRSLTRFPLGTSYEDLHRLVNERLSSFGATASRELVVDAGGPGPPLVDRLRQTLPCNVQLRPVIITGGKGEKTLNGGYTGIPRRSLISTLLLAIGAGALTCEEEIENWDLFENELTGIRGDTTHPGGGNHDDLVLAVALAVSSAVRGTPELLRSVFIGKP